MQLGRIGLSNAESQGKAAVQPGVSEIEIATVVQAVHQLFVFLIAPAMAEANKIQGSGSSYFKSFVLPHPLQKLLCYCDMPANMKLQSLDAIVANYKP